MSANSTPHWDARMGAALYKTRERAPVGVNVRTLQGER